MAPPQATPTQGQADDGDPQDQIEGRESPMTPQGAGALYVCPMHPEITSNQPNQRCPQCKMKLVAKK
jgi:hypothetical protein